MRIPSIWRFCIEQKNRESLFTFWLSPVNLTIFFPKKKSLESNSTIFWRKKSWNFVYIFVLSIWRIFLGKRFKILILRPLRLWHFRVLIWWFQMPLVKHSEETLKYVNNESAHEAGYDAFMSGVIFVRMAHLMAGLTFL